MERQAAQWRADGGVPWLVARQIDGGNERLRLGLVYPFFAGGSDFVRFSGEIIIRSLFLKKLTIKNLIIYRNFEAFFEKRYLQPPQTRRFLKSYPTLTKIRTWQPCGHEICIKISSP
ncbi:MAG: hypothetical protein JNK77_06515 [Saprospiraceae bacterium]|nr:hypothetical protein [Saprospiraceae bacterium]